MSQSGEEADASPPDEDRGAIARPITALSPRFAGAGPILTNQLPNIPRVSFDRRELQDILNLHGRKVAEGEWRDYAMDFNAERAIFAIFRRASENALYRIEKEPALARKQGAYSVVSAHGMVLRRGHDLKRVLAVLEKKLKLVAS